MCRSVTAPPKPWLTFQGVDLTEADRVAIESGHWLNDKHIDFAQALLREQFGSTSALKSTQNLTKHQQPYCRLEAIQVILCRGTASNVVSLGKIQVFNSLFSSVDVTTKKLLTQLFGEEASIEITSGPKQVGGNDCGVFGIATCTSLAHGHQPHEFDRKHVRAHLNQVL